MERRFSLLDGRGRLTVREAGGRVACAGELPDDGQGLYKGWLQGPGGSVPLGAFVPEGGVLRLTRVLPLAELERQGAWPPAGGRAELVFPFGSQGRTRRPPPGWTWEPDPPRLLGEPLLARAWAGGGALLRKDAQGFLLARRFRPDRPFPLPPLFCFARLEELEGERYLVFPFRPGGCPRGG